MRFAGCCGHGLSATAILARTAGNPWWLAFYLLFATAAAIHAGIGIRVIVREWTRWHGRGLDDLPPLRMEFGMRERPRRQAAGKRAEEQAPTRRPRLAPHEIPGE